MYYHIVSFGWELGTRMWLREYGVFIAIAILVMLLLPVSPVGSPNTCLAYKLYKLVKSKLRRKR